MKLQNHELKAQLKGHLGEKYKPEQTPEVKQQIDDQAEADKNFTDLDDKSIPGHINDGVSELMVQHQSREMTDSSDEEE